MSATVSQAAPVKECRQYINGEWVESTDGRTFEDLDPYTGELIARVPAGTRDDAACAVDAAAAAFPEWASAPPEHKQRLFLHAADLIEARRDEIVETLARETGAGSVFAGFQLKRAVGELRQAAGWVYQPTGEVIPSDTPGAFHMAIRRPLGVIGGISPWNGAQVLAWRTVVPPLAFGNTVVLKPSELAPISAGLLLPEIMEEAGFPPGVLNVVTHAPGEAGAIADEYLENDSVRCINFTGSSRTGRMLAERAGRHLKRIVLELGGYNPIIVLRDADLDYAAEATAFGAFFHQGEICMNARKVLVDRPILDEFVVKLAAKARRIKVGDPKEEGTVVGPLITDEALERVTESVQDAVSKGAKVLLGGDPDGRCFQPTILTEVPEGAEIYREETFGPVLVVQPVDGADDAVRAANDHRYGLTAGVLTSDPEAGLAMAQQLDSGIVHINDQTVHDEAQMPLGGVKDSGWGRAGPHSVEDFTHVQWVSVQSGTRHFPI
jgi:acyl-CoA reductase-like NAD-dependent aldehyde dehydrogenase